MVVRVWITTIDTDTDVGMLCTQGMDCCRRRIRSVVVLVCPCMAKIRSSCHVIPVDLARQLSTRTLFQRWRTDERDEMDDTE